MSSEPRSESRPPSAGAPERRGALRGGSLNLPRLAFIGLAYFSLAPAVYLNMGFMESDAGGPVMPILFIVITLAVLPTAVSFAVMSNRRPSAGSGSTWLWESTAPSLGLWLGWMMITAYLVVTALYPPAFGTFFNALLTYAGVHATTWTGIGGGVAAVVIATYMTRHNVQLGATIIGVLMVCEAGFVAVLAVIIVVKGGTLGHFSSVPFDPSHASAGVSGFALAAVFAFLSIAGVDSIAPVAEEAHTPRRLIPLGTILITVIAGVFWTLTSYAFAIAVPVSTVQHYVSSGQITPVLPIAHRYISGFDVLVPITGFTAALASFGASIYAASRLLYAISREGFVPRALAELHARRQTPWRAEALALTFAFVLLVLVSLWQGGAASAYGYLGEIFVFFILIAYIFVNVANLVYHQRYARRELNWLTNVILPIVGIIIDGYILYRAFFVSEINAPFTSGSSLVYISVAWALIGIGWTLWWRRRRDLRSISLSADV